MVCYKANYRTKQVGTTFYFLHFNSFNCILCSGPETGFTKLISLTTTGTLLDL